ncbi:MAG: iron ABC transporter permease [bacterium]|nr:iron ABC transporter permease [bacterium]
MTREKKERSPLTRGGVLAACGVAFGLLALCVVLATSFGAGRIPIVGWLGGAQTLTESERTILFQVRLPRVLLAAILGGSLTVAGTVFQAFLRNPLADPYVLGVSGGASIGGVVALVLGFGAGGLFGGLGIVPLFAFAGALGALLLIEWVATVGGRLTVYTVLLTGAIFNAFSASLIYFIQSVASLEQLHAIVFYLMGRVPAFGYGTLAVIGGATAITTLGLLTLSRDYNALSLGEEGAMHLGVDVERLKRLTFVLGSLLTGLTVSVAGMIGFVGLVVPHMLRLVLGPDHRRLLPCAFFGGGAFLVLADLVARTAIAPNELPVGVVTALVGGPFFLYLLRTRSDRHGFP